MAQFRTFLLHRPAPRIQSTPLRHLELIAIRASKAIPHLRYHLIYVLSHVHSGLTHFRGNADFFADALP